MRRVRFLPMLASVLLVAACGNDTTTTNAASEGVPKGPRFAMVLPGSIQDADYNAAGFAGLNFAAQMFSLETEFSESVAVVDVERVTRGYLDRGFKIVSLHGGQFLTVGLELAPKFPDTTFIVQGGGPLKDAPPNVWNIVRPYYEGFYALGVLAAEVSQTRSIAFLGGLKIPLFKVGRERVFCRSAQRQADNRYRLHIFGRPIGCGQESPGRRGIDRW